MRARLIGAGMLAAVGVGAIALLTRDDGPPDWFERHAAALKAAGDQRRNGVLAEVRDGELPPQALLILDSNGTMDISFIDGPRRDEDVVRTRDFGRRGPPLRWDLDGDGRILGEERRITERELYDATLGAGLPLEAVGGGDPPPDQPVDREDLRLAVARGDLPPMALGLAGPSGFVRVDFVPGPGGEHDVVHTRAGGASGPPLRWDLDGDGRAEARVTERQLYDLARRAAG